MKRRYLETKSIRLPETENTYIFKPFDQKKVQSSKNLWARTDHRIVSDNKYLYVFGGCALRRIAGSYDLKELQRFNLATKQWVLLPVKNIPSFDELSSINLAGNILFVYGGTDVRFSSHYSCTSLYFCDLTAENLEFKRIETTGVGPRCRYGQGCFMDGHQLYVIGGPSNYDPIWCHIHAMDFRSNCWNSIYTCSNRAGEESARYRHGIAKYGDEIYVLGGGPQPNQAVFDFVNIPVFSLQTNRWTTAKTYGDVENGGAYPSKRVDHTTVQRENLVYIFGGRNLRDAWSLDLLTLKWRRVKSLSFPHPPFVHDSCITPVGKIYTFGAFRNENGHIENYADVFEAWVCIPSLKEMCFEAITYYGFHKLDHVDELMPTAYRERIE